MSRIRSACSIRASEPARLYVALLVLALAAPSVALRPAEAQESGATAAEAPIAATTADAVVATSDWVVGSAEEWEEDATVGRRLLKGKVRITREDGSGHLWADEVEMFYDPKGDTRKVQTMQARGDVNLKEADFTATSDLADFTDGTAVVVLSGSVVVLMELDRMEADRFRYDRRTGKKNARGNVQFRFRLPRDDEVLPLAAEAEEEADAQEPDTTEEPNTTTDEAADSAEQQDTEQDAGSEH